MPELTFTVFCCCCCCCFSLKLAICPLGDFAFIDVDVDVDVDVDPSVYNMYKLLDLPRRCIKNYEGSSFLVKMPNTNCTVVIKPVTEMST